MSATIVETPLVYQLKESPYGSHMQLLSALPAQGGNRKMLDLGCSDGYLAAFFSARGYNVTGVERAGGHTAGFPRKVRLIEHDLERGLPRFAEKFSYIVAADILEHLTDPLTLLRQATSILEPGGRVVASLPNSGNLYFRLNVLLGRFPQHDRGLFDRSHLHFFMWRNWTELFTQAGLELESVRSTSVPFGLALRSLPSSFTVGFLERVFYLLAQVWKTLFAYQFVVVARMREVA